MTLQLQAASARDENPFVAISVHWRVAILAYALIWEIFPSLASPLIHGSDQPQLTTWLVLHTAATLVTYFPFMLQRFGGTPIGWLHPLTYLPLLGIAGQITRGFDSLLLPVAVFWEPLAQAGVHPILSGWSQLLIGQARVELASLTLLAGVCYLIGFAVFRPHAARYQWREPSSVPLKTSLLFLVIGLFFMWFLQSRGGLVAHIASFAMGRARSLGDVGHLLVFFGFTPFLLLTWYAYRKDAVRNPVFILLFGLALSMQFLATGSRSSTIYPLIFLMTLWIAHNRKLPKLSLLLAAPLILLAVGLLGDIRRSGNYRADTVDFSAVTDFQLAEALESTMESLAYRSSDGSAALTTVARVPNDVGLLWGETYLAALLFFVPNALWQDKPRGVGAHVSAIIYGHHYGQSGVYKGGGNPVGAVPEAYWNFHVPGVILIFVLFGAFQHWLVNFFVKNRQSSAALLFFLITLFVLRAPGTGPLVAYLHTIILWGAAMVAFGLRLRRPQPDRSTGEGAMRWSQSLR